MNYPEKTIDELVAEADSAATDDYAIACLREAVDRLRAEPKKLTTDTAYKAVNFIATYTGRQMFPLSPTPDMVTIIDIAHHLANQCRYSGASMFMYSTAQHCCLLFDYVRKVRKGTPLDCLQILMHDAAEYALVDMPRPVKQHMPEYRKWDYTLTMCIRQWVGLGSEPIPPWQDELDSRIIMDEREQVIFDQDTDWQHSLEPLGIVIEPWEPHHAEQQFLARYAHCTHEVFGTPQYLRSGWGIPLTSIYQPNFRTEGSDIAQHGDTEPRTITDLLEVDIRGGCGRVALRSPDGMMIRDRSAGKFPRPAWEFIHGAFQLTEASKLTTKGAGNGVG